MDAVSTENETKTAFSDVNDTSGQSAAAYPGWPVPEFKWHLSNDPLWPEFLEELKVQREADIAESNRLADLELAELEQK